MFTEMSHLSGLRPLSFPTSSILNPPWDPSQIPCLETQLKDFYFIFWRKVCLWSWSSSPLCCLVSWLQGIYFLLFSGAETSPTSFLHRYWISDFRSSAHTASTLQTESGLNTILSLCYLDMSRLMAQCPYTVTVLLISKNSQVRMNNNSESFHLIFTYHMPGILSTVEVYFIHPSILEWSVIRLV